MKKSHRVAHENQRRGGFCYYHYTTFIAAVKIPFFKRLRKFTFGNNGVDSTYDAPIKYQAMTCGFTILLLSTTNKPLFSLSISSVQFTLIFLIIYKPQI